MSSLMVRRPDELLARCAGFLDLPSAGHLAQASRAGQRLVLARNRINGDLPPRTPARCALGMQ